MFYVEFPTEIHDDDDGDFKTALEYPRWELSIAASSPPPHPLVRKLDGGRGEIRPPNSYRKVQTNSDTVSNTSVPVFPQVLDDRPRRQ